MAEERLLIEAGEEEEEEATDWADLKASLRRMTEQWKTKAGGKWILKKEGRAEWRVGLGEALESTTTHVIIVVLLLVDLLATAIDILKEIHTNHTNLRQCVERLESCTTPSDFEALEPPWEWLGWVGVAILFVLLLNVLLLLLAFGKSFFSHPGYVLDALVVLTALFLELFLEADTAGLLVILTLWRIVRVAHGIFEVTDEAWETDMKKVEQRLHVLEQAQDKNQQLLRWRQDRISQLEATLASYSS